MGSRDSKLEAVGLAAGTAAFVAASSFFVHWRVRAFLVLNLLLLAILLSSGVWIPSSSSSRECGSTRKRRKKERWELKKAEDGAFGKSEQEEEEEDDDDEVSKEELNQRVEAFITILKTSYGESIFYMVWIVEELAS
ncbi:hypothetical protein M569_14790 [Genlisea aurea]|uniref:Uncharacterized protein n=1 Tax=Genlisea aurea TaxID=192259 RepID=S8C048_9LAMI|nr:hypothetical protein M569_14790 [Genlisea aurea]